MNVLGIDIGGSAVKGAPVDTRRGRLLADRFRVPTPEKLTPARLAKVVDEVSRHFHWRGRIGIGFPGVIRDTQILTSANLHPRLIGCDGVSLFSRATGCPVALINDAAAAALAEAKFGAGRGFRGKALLLTLGTGVGSALISEGVVFPLELGHLPLRGRSAERSVSSAVRERKDLSWKDWAARLNAYLEIVEAIIQPELLIIGGGVSSKHEKFFPYLHTRARLVPARLGNRAGVVGAAMRGEKARRPRVR